jgi:hypothetical protein
MVLNCKHLLGQWHREGSAIWFSVSVAGFTLMPGRWLYIGCYELAWLRGWGNLALLHVSLTLQQASLSMFLKQGQRFKSREQFSETCSTWFTNISLAKPVIWEAWSQKMKHITWPRWGHMANYKAKDMNIWRYKELGLNDTICHNWCPGSRLNGASVCPLGPGAGMDRTLFPPSSVLFRP